MMGGGEEKKSLVLFKAEWCGHCKSFKSTWDELKDKMESKINFISYDSELNKKEIDKYKIEGFPTLILLSGDKAIEYVGARDKKTIEEFINQY